jgi:hypothetical protein
MFQTNGERNEKPSSSMFGFGHGVRSIASGQSLMGASDAVQFLQLPYGYTYPNSYAYGYGYPHSSYAYDYGNPFSIVTAPMAAVTAPLTAFAAPVAQVATAPFAATAPATAPMMTGRTVATMGRMCSAPAKSCELYQASWVGNGCSCKVPGGRARGSVTPNPSRRPWK